MPDFQKKTKNPYRRFFINLGALAIVGILITLVVADVKVYQKHKELDTQVLGLKQKVENLKQQNAQLKEGMARQDDPAYIEKVAREELDLQLSGEKVISFVQASNQKAVTPATKPNVLQLWLGWIGGWFKK